MHKNLLERIKASVSRDIEIAESEGFIPTELTTLYLLVNIAEHLDERTYFPLLGQKQEAVEPLNGHPAPDSMDLSPDPNLNIWVGDDVQERLNQLREQGVTHLLWKVSDGACDVCRQNDMQQVALGERFNTGHQLPPGHPHCYCEVVYLHNGQEEEEQDNTQEMPAIKKQMLSLTESDLWEGRE